MGRLGAWTSGFLLVLLSIHAVRLGGLDSSADFSFSLSPSAAAGSYRLLGVPQVAAIFAERSARKDSERLARHLLKVCLKNRFDPAFVLSLINVESSFRVDAISPAGAVGLMQLMPATAGWLAKSRGLGRAGDLRDPYRNLTLGVAYLSYLRDRYPELSPFELLSAYRMGPARVAAIQKAHGSGGLTRNESKKYFQAVRRGFSVLHTRPQELLHNEVPEHRKWGRHPGV